MKRLITLLFILMVSFPAYSYTFQSAKQWAFSIYYNHRKTFYCGCRYSTSGKVMASQCGFSSIRNSERANWIEWEHVVPVSHFGRSFKEWKGGHEECQGGNGKTYKGRRCVRKVSKKFKEIEGDLYNLVPVIGELNNARSNTKMGVIAGEKRAFGKCDFEVFKGIIEPRPDIKGDIARTYFYMDYRYPGYDIIDSKDRAMFELWNKQDPVDSWERERAWEIYEVQGNPNPFILGFDN